MRDGEVRGGASSGGLPAALCVLVLAKGPSWAVYNVTARAAPSGRLMLALGVAGGILALALGALLRTLRARPRKPALGSA